MSETNHRAHMLRYNADPEFQAKRLAGLRTRFADPEFRARHGAAIAARLKAWRARDPDWKAKTLAGKKAKRLAKIQVPPWVPAVLEAEFRRVADESGEFEACAHIRALKRESF